MAWASRRTSARSGIVSGRSRRSPRVPPRRGGAPVMALTEALLAIEARLEEAVCYIAQLG